MNSEYLICNSQNMFLSSKIVYFQAMVPRLLNNLLASSFLWIPICYYHAQQILMKISFFHFLSLYYLGSYWLFSVSTSTILRHCFVDERTFSKRFSPFSLIASNFFVTTVNAIRIKIIFSIYFSFHLSFCHLFEHYCLL